MTETPEKKAKLTYLKAKDWLDMHPFENGEETKHYVYCANIAVSKEQMYSRSRNPEDRKEAIQYANIVKKKYLEFYQVHALQHRRLPFLKNKDEKEVRAFMMAARNSLDVLARMGDFDAFCIAVEFYRKHSECFYMPRREFFMNMETVEGQRVNIIKDCQDFVDSKLDFLFFAMPQRCGKTTLCAFVLVFRAFKDLSKSTFGLAHSTELANHFFDLVCMFMGEGSAFRTFEIFEGHSVPRECKNKEYRELDIDEKHPFPNFAYKSIDGQITGSTEASLTAYADDLVKEQNEVVNTQIADNIWTKVNTYIFGRKKKGVPVLGAATLWGENCPFTRYISHLKKTEPNNPRVRVRQFAWCNSEGESQFDYHFDLGFDTKHFVALRSTMQEADNPLWEAMYMSNPIPRDGRPLSDLDFYISLPDRAPDYIAMVADTAVVTSGDHWSAPMGYFYEDDRQVYIEDVVYTNEGIDIALPKTVEMCLKHRPIQIELEEKEATQGKVKSGLWKALDERLKKVGLNPYIHSHSAAGQQSKRARIMNHVAAIKGIPVDGMWTLHFSQEQYEKNPAYKKFIRSIVNWSEADRAQKTQEDDGPDSCAMMLTYMTSPQTTKVNVFKATDFY